MTSRRSGRETAPPPTGDVWVETEIPPPTQLTKRGGHRVKSYSAFQRGNTIYRVGDMVAVKNTRLKPLVAIIRHFFEDLDEREPSQRMRFVIAWFERCDDPGIKPEVPPLQNEVYISSLMNDDNTISMILHHVHVLPPTSFTQKFPRGIPIRSKDINIYYQCQRGINNKKMKFVGINIEEVLKGRDTDFVGIADRIDEEAGVKLTKADRDMRISPGYETDSEDEEDDQDEREGSPTERTKKAQPKKAATKKAPAKKAMEAKRVSDGEDSDEIMNEASDHEPEEPSSSESDESEEVITSDEEVAQRRSRKRKRGTGTPRKSRPASASRGPKSPTKTRTPTNRRILKPLEITPLPMRTLSPSQYLSSPYQLARARLHVSAVPASLPCREGEFESIYTHLHTSILEGHGSCLYISGTPGTGKTATVREVVRSLRESVEEGDLDDFIFVEINGMKVTEANQAYAMLWEVLSGERVTPSHALSLLEAEFSGPSPRRIPCVVLMDELDQLVTKKQTVMYNFFNWPSLRHSRLIVAAVANTMDLPERMLSNKISSRLGLTRITFPGYTHGQLETIIQSRLEGVPSDIVSKDAIGFASRKVAGVSGDARRALDICRRAVELAEATTDDPATQSTERKPQTGRVTIKVIQQAIAEMTSSPIQAYLRSLPLACKVFLAALMARTRRSGIAENATGDVVDEAGRMCKVSENQDVQQLLLTEGKGRVRGILKAAADLADAGVVIMEAKGGDRGGRVRLKIGEEEVKMAFAEDRDVIGMA
ncbi:Origin recognition complex, subunit 1 [Saitoella coloradoensis]